MKKTIFTAAVMLAAATTGFLSCKKDESNPNPSNPYKCTSCVTTPDALPENDASSKGVYKGTVIGSSGTIKFSVQNGGNDITAVMVLDGTTVNLTSSVSWIDGAPYVAPFTGTMDGNPVTITFAVQADGSNPVITSADIPGHPNAVFTLQKETSNALLECFEGSYSTTKPETGTFNILLSRSLGKWGGRTQKSGSTEGSNIKGVLDGNVIKSEDGTVMGNLNGDVITGSFQDEKGRTVTIEGERTL